MTTRIKNVLVFSLTILAATAVYIWFYPMDKGILSITADSANYLIISEENTIQCPQNPCITSLKTGFHGIKIQKDKFYPENINVEIKRGETKKISVKFKKIPTLSLSPTAPKDKTELKTLPEKLKNQSLLAPVWDESETMLAFIDQDDNRLKIWDKTGTRAVTALRNIGNDFVLHWSPDQKYLFGTDRKDIYFIDIKKASRKKDILEFDPQNTIWSLKSDYLLVNDDKNILYKIDFSKMSTESLETTLDLGNAVWGKGESLIFFSYDKEENKTIIESYDLSAQKKQEILTKYNFPVGKISSDENKKVYLYNSNEKAWYGLDY